MARIPDDEIERLKAEVSLVRLLEGQGFDLKKSGKDFLTRCPFHADGTPSLVVSPAKNLFHCFGCDAGGTVIDWVMKAEGVSFRHAVELLRADYQPSAVEPVKRTTVTKLPTALSTDAEDQALLNRVIDFYHEALKQDAEALAYLKKRGLIHPELIDTFKLGVSNRTLGYRLPRKNRKEGEALRGQLQRLGIYRESGHEHFNGSLVIPVIDAQGNVQEVYGRKLRDDLRPGTAYHLYLPGPHEGVFNTQAFSATQEIILCESLIDALTFWCAGYRNVTTSYGTNGFTAHHLAAFQEHKIERVLIAYDRDEAGDKAADALAAQLMKEGIDCYRILFPKGMDANQYALEVQPAHKSLGVVIRSAQWLGKGDKKAITTTAVTGAESSPAKQQFEQQLKTVSEQMKTLGKPLPVETSEPETVLPASPLPSMPATPDVSADVKEHELVFHFGNRRYRVRGLEANTRFNVLKINLLVTDDKAVHVDSFDLYHARARANFIRLAAVELGVKDDVIKTDLSQLLLKLESLQEAQIKAAQVPVAQSVQLSEDEQREALALLNAPDLLARIVNDVNRSGLVGEDLNALVGYLACVSRRLDNPLAVIIQSTSAAGKSSLMDAVLNLMPEEERVRYSAMTGQSLFYMGETNLKHKILAIAEEEGAQHAAYALKLLQSEGELTIASTGKNETTGDLVTKEYRVEGPVMLFLTTTAIDIDEELMNRCLVLTVNEAREQTQAIHQLQRKKRTLNGLLQKHEARGLIALHRNAQRLLRPLHVVNPYADQLTFVDTQTRTRRDHEKYLTLIDAIALLHQYQRPVKTVQHQGSVIEYVEVTLSDIEQANRLAHDVFGRTLDELPPQTRTLLRLVDRMVRERCEALSMERSSYRFSRRELREVTAWGNTQLGVHLDRLVKMEYLLVHRGGRGQSFVYELLYDGSAQERAHLNGLLDVAQLKNKSTTESVRGESPGCTGSKRPQNGANTGGVRHAKVSDNPTADNDLSDARAKNKKNAPLARAAKTESYAQAPAIRAKGN